jgi:hypothetical protein
MIVDTDAHHEAHEACPEQGRRGHEGRITKRIHRRGAENAELEKIEFRNSNFEI